MKDEVKNIDEKRGFFKRLFGQKKSSCCSFNIEEMDVPDDKSSNKGKYIQSSCCCSTPRTDVEKNEDDKE
jgi:hypothetical protein